MTRRPATILQADIARRIRAAKQCGLQIREIKPDGTLVVDSGEKSASSPIVHVAPKREMRL